MGLALRLLRLTASTVVCILLFAALFQFVKEIPSLSILTESIADLEAHGTNVPKLASLGWGVVFHGPGYVFWGTVPLLLTLLTLDLRRVRHVAVYATVWAAAGLAASGVASRDVHATIASAAAAMIAGLVYWLLAGRSAGAWIDSLKGRKRVSGIPLLGRLGIWDVTAYAVLAFFGLQLTGYLHYGAKLFWVSHVSEPSLGVPPFKTGVNGHESAPSAFHRVALMDFPDPASCLKKGTDSHSPQDLRRMDWDKIDNTAEAEVCTFRLLGSYEDMSYATAWLEGQGFHVSDGWSSTNPFQEPNGDLRVTGSWSIRERGPRFPTRGIVRRLFHSIPYGMGVNARWSADGKSLKHVTIVFSTL